MGCCSDRFITVIKLAVAHQQHFTINHGRTVHEPQQQLSPDQFAVERFAVDVNHHDIDSDH